MSNRKRVAGNAPGGAMGDVLEELRSEGHINALQYTGGAMLLAKMERAAGGSSAGMVMALLDKVDGSGHGSGGPTGGDVAALQELDRIMKGLRSHERRLMKFLATHTELARGSLSDWGRIHSSYETRKLGRAVTVGKVGSFLDSVAELCLPPTPS